MRKGNVFFCFTVDTECDRSPDWSTSQPLSFHGVLDAIPNILHPLLQKYHIRPTFLISHEVMDNPECCRVLKALQNCELGTHLHGDFVEPQKNQGEFAGTLCKAMQCDYEYDIEYQKLKTLTQMFITNFGYQPKAFRAGRFGIGHNSGKALMELGYKIDSSVTPHLVWKNKDTSHIVDFREAPEQPYFISTSGDIWKKGDADFLEIPITIRENKEGNFGRLLGKKTKSQWLRPWYSDAKVINDIIQDTHRKRKESPIPIILVMMLHNVELIPGASPYPQTEEEVLQYLKSLTMIFSYIETLGIVPATLTEVYGMLKNVV